MYKYKPKFWTKFTTPSNTQGKIDTFIEDDKIQSIRLHLIYPDGGELLQNFLIDPIAIKAMIEHFQKTLKVFKILEKQK